MSKPVRRSGNLPAEATSFIGRRRELAELKRKLRDARLVTLAGPGGVGKTRLAIRAATDLGRGFRDGVWLVELAEVQDPGLVSNAVMAALDLRDQAATEPLALLRSFLEDKQLLLVMDNCEHLLGAVAQLVAELIRAAAGVRVVATSREPLSVSGEHVTPVPPLELPPPHAREPLAHVRQNEAVMLFSERAEAASGAFELTTSNQAAVVDLCRRLDGLPLAIELAAVRTRLLTPEQILGRLTDRFSLLTGGSRAALPRAQTLRTAIDWSYDLLSGEERTLLRRLCVFAGRFTLGDVEGVCTSEDVPPPRAMDLMSALVDKSLAIKEEAATTTCYRLHETMREYAFLKLREAGEEHVVEQRCVEHYLSMSQRFGAEARYHLLEWLGSMDLEIDNVRSVLRRCLVQEDFTRGIDLASSMGWFWITRATTEGVRWLDQLLPSVPGDSTAHGWACFMRGFLSVLQGDPAAARPWLDRAVAVARRAPDPSLLAHSLSMGSVADRMAGDRESAARSLDEAQGVAAGLEDPAATLGVLQARAIIGFFDGELDTVRSATSEGIRLARDVNDLYALEVMLGELAGVGLITGGKVGELKALYAEGLRIARQIDDRVTQFYYVDALACLAARSGQPRLAAQLLGAAETMRSAAGASELAFLGPVRAEAEESAIAALGPSDFEAEKEAGMRSSREAALGLALGESDRRAVAGDHGQMAGLLGKREAEVAALIADGLSNKQIGARLFISERTVDSHVRSIMNKLGFSSRAQIAAWTASSNV